MEAVRKEGFSVELGPNVYCRKGYLAGDERARADDLVDFFQRSDIDAIFCARGGFGSMQLLPHMRNELKPKIFVGYSDITVLLNWFLQKFHMVTFHAPMVAMDIAHGLSARAKEHFWGLLTGETTEWKVELGEIIRPGVIEAEMVGGCLSLLVTTLGTPYEVDTTGKLLFLEDTDEKPYRIERMLTHLKMAGKLDRLSGVVFGDFTRCDGEGTRDVRQVIGELFADAPYPVVMGMAAGHGQENLALPFGVKMALNGQAGTLSLTESPVA
jgi:muramoyltetrapeptide carboxypeptidase